MYIVSNRSPLAPYSVLRNNHLIRKRIRTERPICVLDSCSAVLESNIINFSIPNDILGLLTYGMIFLLSGFILYGIIPTEFTYLVLSLVSLDVRRRFISYIE